MGYLPTLGLSVLGLFAAVTLTGVLGGVIAFGLIDASQRQSVQQRVLWVNLDKPVESRLDQSESSLLPVGVLQSWGRESLAILQAYRPYKADRPVLSLLAQVEPKHLFQLPYRQLCGQIASAVSAEGQESDDGAPSKIPAPRPLTLALYLADRARPSTRKDPSRLVSEAHVTSRALAFLDTLQIALAEAVLERAAMIASIVVFLVSVTGLIPNVGFLDLSSGSPTLMKAIAGVLIEVAARLPLAAMLFGASLIIAMLTFRWLDRVASAR